ncbi:DUF4041 domain-containing protein [Acinetobacter johnsonii]|uniref:DUF4041 domain-containing protein n=1 Tax=Acinetobacter johnsonii TaxID=40214 RepID=UPI003BB78A27
MHSLAQKKKIESLESNLERNRNSLEVYEQQQSELQHRLTSLRIELGTLRQRNETLSPYQEIIDVEHYVIERHNQVELFAETVKFDAEQMLKQCRQRIEKVHHFLTEYERKAKEMSMLRAREKLGAFFHMAEERQHLAEISKALHHKIETYSQSYQLPSEQLLDELIEGYGKTDAACHLLKVRQQVIRAVEQNDVVTCAFMDENRRLSMMVLVSQLFNTKADFYLQRVSKDNIGLLIQSLQDDFTLINHYGAAFGHTRIQDSYLALRLEELKFAALLESLKSSDLQFQAEILVEHRVLQ